MSYVSEILKNKGNRVLTVKPQDKVLDALKLMAQENVGAVLVLEGSKIAGIFSERDYARHSIKHNLHPENILVKDMMTSHVYFVTPSQSTDECLSVMTSKHIRHLPVLEDHQLIGIISIGDVVKKIIEDHKFSISQLERYVTGEV